MVADDEDVRQRLKIARRQLDAGENFLAYDIAECCSVNTVGGLLKKIQVMALALARSGSLRRARELVDGLPNVQDSEIVGLKARMLKDLAIQSTDEAERRALFRQSAQVNEAYYHVGRAYYNGINAASCYLLSGDAEKARMLAEGELWPQLQMECAAGEPDVWLEATLGECEFLRGNLNGAVERYRSAVSAFADKGQYGSMGAMLRQLRLLLDQIVLDAGGRKKFLSKLELPTVAVFSGHIIDCPDCAKPRFPVGAISEVKRRIAETIRRRRIKFGFSSCAAGGDILFAEALLENGGTWFLVPPFSLEDTRRKSVEGVSPGDWGTRLDRLLACRERVRVLPNECESIQDNDWVAYDFVNRYLLGLAFLRARDLSLPLTGVCVWDGQRGGMPGGTASATALWQSRKLDFEIIDPTEVRK